MVTIVLLLLCLDYLDLQQKLCQYVKVDKTLLELSKHIELTF